MSLNYGIIYMFHLSVVIVASYIMHFCRYLGLANTDRERIYSIACRITVFQITNN